MIFRLLTLALALSGPVHAQEDIVGSWLFVKYKYRGVVIPAPNPNLRQIMTFTDSGTSTLFYKRLDEDGFCERRAVFTYSPASKLLFQQVVWVNPDNHSSCAMDPDMQLGKKTENKAWVESGSFYLELPLSDETITFIWSPIETDR
ncbi:MAG: hypothetical protein N2578_02960 [Bdellovibrionaceae bacterium]|nr:hypothetical protein [Pseudobdellovibrionaceae bacterium]